MSTIELNWNPTQRQLRQFGLIALVALPLIGWIFSGRPGLSSWDATHTSVIGSLAALGGLLALLGFVWPAAVKPVFIGACVVAYPIGLVIGELVILMLFWLVFTPVALLFRLIGRDALERRIDRSRATYWNAKQPPRNLNSYYRQS